MSKTRQCDIDFVAEARTWLGVPFLHQGRSRQGVDCIGLLICVGEITGRVPENFERNNYGRETDTVELIRKIKSYCEPLEAPELGCLMTMSWGQFPRHSALFCGYNRHGQPRMLHSFGKIGIHKVIEHGWTGPWPRVTNGFWRIPERIE